jgi:TrmH family RNA methyltransferase
MIEFISSPQNPKVKKLLALQQKSSERRAEGLFVVEGRREIEHCIEAGYEIDTVFVCPGIAGKTPDQVGAGAVMPGCDRASKVFEVSPAVYEKIAYRAGTEGVIAEVKARSTRLEDLDLPSDPLVMVLESVEKPGNLGAVLRSADACGADAVIVCDPLTDLWNPNLIRSSIGAIFTVPTVACSSAECIDFLKAKGIRIFTAQLQDSELYYDTDFRGPSAIVMGTESTGLTDIWRKAADAHIRIPMLGRLDSLNVSVSAAILLYEAVRQRGV